MLAQFTLIYTKRSLATRRAPAAATGPGSTPITHTLLKLKCPSPLYPLQKGIQNSVGLAHEPLSVIKGDARHGKWTLSKYS